MEYRLLFLFQVHYGICLLCTWNFNNALNKTIDSAKVSTQTREVFNLRRIVFFSNIGFISRCGRWTDMFVFSFYKSYF